MMIAMLEFRQVQLKVTDLERGLYSFAELKDYIDWEVKRVYFVQRIQESGQHCHFIENEMFIMARGNCTAVIDCGNGKEGIKFRAPGDAIVCNHHVWHGFKDFSDDALLLALSSTNYNPDRSDYCEDYEKYLEIVKGFKD